MTAFEKWRDAFLSDLFARVVVLLLFAWVLIQWTALQRAEQRADAAESTVAQLRAELAHIGNGCVRNDVGEGQCRAGTFKVPATTTTTGAP